jgi:hypothetical protein
MDSERCLRVDTKCFSAAIYPSDSEIEAVWYDDPIGRNSDGGRTEKVRLYLERYGAIENWELRLDNGWMHYWFNSEDNAAMVYGTHNDVIRFNYYDAESAEQGSTGNDG